MRTPHMLRFLACLLVAAGCGASPPADEAALAADGNAISAASNCVVQGTWILQSVTADGEPAPLDGWTQMKIITPTHYAWVGHRDGGAGPLASSADSLNAYRTRASGGGRYRLTDSTYIEQLEYFSDPRHVGREVEITCRIEGDLWQHDFDWPAAEPGQEPRVVRVAEVWRRQ